MTAPDEPTRAMAEEVRSFASGDGVELYYRAWELPEARAVVRIIHGLGEHSGRYGRLVAALRDHGIASYALDLRGHGVSGGRRGHVSRFEEFLDDVDRFTRLTAAAVPSFLFGHSLGGLIALRAMETGQVGDLTGAVLSAPALGLASPAPLWKRLAASVLSRVAPQAAQANGIDPADLSRDPAEVEAYRSDPLVHDRITPRLYVEMRQAMRAAALAASQVRVPVLLLAPGEDRVTLAPTALQVASRFAGDVKTRLYAGFFHESLNDRSQEAVVADVMAWIDEKVQ